jgi:hypothetical protein
MTKGIFQVGFNEIQSRKRGPRVLLKVTWKTIADAKGCSERTVKRAVEAGKLNPHDLESIAEYINAVGA